jgi:hypothetical protein
MRFSGRIILRQAQDASVFVFPENWSYPCTDIRFEHIEINEMLNSQIFPSPYPSPEGRGNKNRLLLPLPPGEGWGEGLQVCAKYCNIYHNLERFSKIYFSNFFQLQSRYQTTCSIHCNHCQFIRLPVGIICPIIRTTFIAIRGIEI